MCGFDVIKKENYRTLWPQYSKLNIDSLDEGSAQHCLMIYSACRYLLTEYLSEKLNLKSFDDRLTNSGLNYIKVDESAMDVYQHFSRNSLNYFYLRNNLYLERLTNEELAFLESRINSGSCILDDDTKRFIDGTFKKLIFEDVQGNGAGNMMANFGNGSSDVALRFMAINNSVVIGARFDDFNTNGLDDSTWNALYMRQRENMDIVTSEIEKIGSSKLNFPVKAIKYDDYSVQPIYGGDPGVKS